MSALRRFILEDDLLGREDERDDSLENFEYEPENKKNKSLGIDDEGWERLKQPEHPDLGRKDVFADPDDDGLETREDELGEKDFLDNESDLEEFDSEELSPADTDEYDDTNTDTYLFDDDDISINIDDIDDYIYEDDLDACECIIDEDMPESEEFDPESFDLDDYESPDLDYEGPAFGDTNNLFEDTRFGTGSGGSGMPVSPLDLRTYTLSCLKSLLDLYNDEFKDLDIKSIDTTDETAYHNIFNKMIASLLLSQ